MTAVAVDASVGPGTGAAPVRRFHQGAAMSRKLRPQGYTSPTC